MSDDNKELIGRLARRLEEPVVLPDTEAIPTVSGRDWNVPIDQTMADSKTETAILRGMAGRVSEWIRQWQPRPMPADWDGT